MRTRFGLFEFNDRTGELRREGELVKLPPQPARVLALLLAKPGEVVLREELRQHIWGQDTFVDFERGLNFCILQVRTALGDNSDNPRFVQTVPRKGYRFIAPVAFPQDGSERNGHDPRPTTQDDGERQRSQRESLKTQDGSERSGHDPRPTSQDDRERQRSQREKLALLVAAAALLILGPAIWLFLGRAPTSATASPPARIRIAVLPFANLTSDGEADYVADGVTDELIAQLGRINPKRLGVIARTSVMRYRNTDKSVSEIGRELDVHYVLEGSVRREGTRVRVTTDLIDATDQAQVWSDVFERPAGETMDLQTDLATRVARALTLAVIPGEPAVSLARSTKISEAWDAYLRGRYFLARGGMDVGKAVEQFETAVRLDAQFAAAWAQLAEAQHVLVMVGQRSPNDAYPHASEAANRALALDDSLADAHVANGIVLLWYRWQPAAAARAFERALAINDSHGAAHHDYAWSLVALGRFDEAVTHITAARDIDPLSLRANNDIGWLFLHLRQPTEAARACQHTLAIQPESLEAQACLERAYAQRGMFVEAVRAAELASSVFKLETLDRAASAREQLNGFWRFRLQQLQSAAQTHWVSPYQLAVHYAFIGDQQRAIEQLHQAFAERIGILVFAKTDPALDAVRSHPRFETLLQNLPEDLR